MTKFFKLPTIYKSGEVVMAKKNVVKVLTDEDRFRLAEELGKKRDEEKRLAYYEAHKFTGGARFDPRSCHSCEFVSGGGAKCTNPAAMLMGANLEGDGLRLDTGLCGPRGVFWKQDPKPAQLKRKKRNEAVFVIMLIIAALALMVFFLGVKATAIIIGICFILGLFFGD